MNKTFEPANPELFFKKNDPTDPRLGEFVSNEMRNAFAIGGYPDDEGIKLSKGRAGAAGAPDVIRKYFYKMTPPLNLRGAPRLFDAGNLVLKSGDLSSRHEKARETVREALNQGALWSGLGGGHDYGYSDGAGFLDVYGKERPLIINFDAHLDVRSDKNGLSSGTPFYRLLENHEDFDFVEIGIQSQCNSRSHLEWVQDHGARVVTWDEIQASGRRLLDVVADRMADWLLRPRPTYLSIDLDGFSTGVAPGVSQGFATGFESREFFELFDVLATRLNVRCLGLYEASPALDIDDRTSKLAALILHRFLQAKWSEISS